MTVMVLPDLDGLIAEVDRTCATAHPGNAAREQPEWTELLRTAAGIAGQLQALADDLVEEYVEHCRMHGLSWSEVGEALGVTRQAAQQRFLAPSTEYDQGEFSDDLTSAMTAMKRAAVYHRNNYIGTEHVLWGLLAERNSATAELIALGVQVDELRTMLEGRLVLGASQAAQRIAWTPYARRVIALAKERASKAGAETIGCNHVLGGLAQIGRGVAADVLTIAGIGLDDLETHPPNRPTPWATPGSKAPHVG